MKQQKEVIIECSINLHKRIHGIKFQNRSARAIKEIKKFAQKVTNAKDVRIDSTLNKEICKNGSRTVPFKIKVRLFKKHCLDERKGNFWTVFVYLIKNYPSK